MILNSKCLLTFIEEGALVQVTGICKVKKVAGGKTIFEKEFLKNAKVAGEVQNTRTLHERFVEFATSDEGIVDGYTKGQWARLGDMQRLKAHIKELVPANHTFTFKLL